MLVPSKVFTLDNSIIGKVAFLIIDNVSEISLRELFDLRGKHFNDIGEFILAVDVLYILGVIELRKGLICYVARNKV